MNQYQKNILLHKGSWSVYFFLFSLVFVFTLSSESPADQDNGMQMIVTGQVRWSVLGDGWNYFKAEGIVSGQEGIGHEQHRSQGPYPVQAQDEIFSHDHQLIEKVRESAMPNRAQKPVYRVP